MSVSEWLWTEIYVLHIYGCSSIHKWFPYIGVIDWLLYFYFFTLLEARTFLKFFFSVFGKKFFYYLNFYKVFFCFKAAYVLFMCGMLSLTFIYLMTLFFDETHCVKAYFKILCIHLAIGKYKYKLFFFKLINSIKNLLFL